jgi:hypothetical protein
MPTLRTGDIAFYYETRYAPVDGVPGLGEVTRQAGAEPASIVESPLKPDGK